MTATGDRTNDRAPDTRIDDLRQQLRALGYLESGVDRFVLAPAQGARGPAAVALRSGIRVGVLAGVLLGPCAAIGLTARVTGLVSGVRDAAVLAAYFGILFFLGFAVFSSIVSLGGAALARRGREDFAVRGRRVSRAAGALVTCACLAYLTLWWRTANAGFGWSAPVWTTAALALAAAISLLVGHAVRIATLAVIAASGDRQAIPPVPRRSWTFVAAGGVTAFVGAAALLMATAPTDSSAALDHPPITVASPAARVCLIAIDGFDPAIYEQHKQELPNLRSLLSGRRATLQPQDTLDPARAWTTIATGVTPDVHGVHAIETRRVAGLRGAIASGGGSVARVVGAATDMVRLTHPSIASREQRNAKSIWEVAEEAGLRTAVVNWWATWPAPSTGGVVVTDRALLRLEHGGILDGEIAPPALYDSLRSYWPAMRERVKRTAASAFPDGGDAQVTNILRRSAELDATILGLALALPRSTLDLLTVYLPGLDIAQHALLVPSEDAALAPSSVAARVDALRSYYSFLDRTIAPLVEPGDKQIVMGVTQPGRIRTATGGLFAVASGVKDEVNGPVPATTVDVAPTVWHALGLPQSRELAGKPLTELLGDSFHAADRYVPTYGRPFTAPVRRAGQPLDQEMIDRLRSLGYVK